MGKHQGCEAATNITSEFGPSVGWGNCLQQLYDLRILLWYGSLVSLLYICNTETLTCVLQNKPIRHKYNCFIVADIGNLAKPREQIFCVFLYSDLHSHTYSNSIRLTHFLNNMHIIFFLWNYKTVIFWLRYLNTQKWRILLRFLVWNWLKRCCFN